MITRPVVYFPGAGCLCQLNLSVSLSCHLLLFPLHLVTHLAVQCPLVDVWDGNLLVGVWGGSLLLDTRNCHLWSPRPTLV